VTASSAPRVKVLFVCIGNSCRSQMAEALARHHAADVMEASSAGVSPLGRIVDPTHKVLHERGIRADGQFSKGVREAAPGAADIIVNMTGMPGRSLFRGANVLDWEISDPYGEDLLIYREVCDEIAERVQALAQTLRAKRAAPAAGAAVSRASENPL